MLGQKMNTVMNRNGEVIVKSLGNNNKCQNKCPMDSNGINMKKPDYSFFFSHLSKFADKLK